MNMTLSLIFLLGLGFTACATDTDWDSGGRSAAAFRHEQRQERIETTRQQIPTAGDPMPSQAQPF